MTVIYLCVGRRYESDQALGKDEEKMVIKGNKQEWKHRKEWLRNLFGTGKKIKEVRIKSTRQTASFKNKVRPARTIQKVRVVYT